MSIRDVNAATAKDKKLDRIEGVYIDALSEGGAAAEVGLEKGDIILSVNDVKVNSTAELQEQIGRYRPGEKVTVVVNRDNKKKQFDVVLRNREGDTKIVKPEEVDAVLGATFAQPSGDLIKKLGIESGVQVKELGEGKIRNSGIRKDFIITRINNKPVSTVDDIKNTLRNVKGGVYIEGVYPNGVIAYYAFGM